MKEIEEDFAHPPEKRKKGSWNYLYLTGKDNKSATFICPNCGELGVLTDHEIDDDGTVKPSVVCPTEGCDFHDFIKLKGWENAKYPS